jgi:glycosyltransferase involved in cell wall biosynthesis
MVEILLATYNGEKFIRRQLESLLEQTSGDWKLLIRDDGSTDATVAVCREFAASQPDRIRLITSGSNLGVRGNFNRLIRQSDADYIMFCDQDDVWLPQKIERSLAAMREMEKECGANVPLLVHTDSRVVNANLETIAPSASRWVGRATGTHLGRVCMELPLFGHQMMINRALKDFSGAIPEGFVSWDWWYPLVATAFGRVAFVDEPLVLWRRHPAAASEVNERRVSTLLSRSLADYRRKVHISLRQCEIFHERFEEKLSAGQNAFFAGVGRIRQSGWLTRRALILRYRLFKTGLLKNAVVLLVV